MRLALDELFDLSLYGSLRALATGDVAAILDRLIPIEARHFALWQDFFGLAVERLARAGRLKLPLIVRTLPALRRVGDPPRPGDDRGLRRAEVPRGPERLPRRAARRRRVHDPRGREFKAT